MLVYSLSDLLSNENRCSKLRFHEGNLSLDLSRTLVNEHDLAQLVDLLSRRLVDQRLVDMHTGQLVNTSEKRPVLHTLLRGTIDDSSSEYLVNEKLFINEQHQKMIDFVNKVHSGVILTPSGKRVSSVINIGIGGSDLGPAMVFEALSSNYSNLVEIRYLSNIDTHDFNKATKDLDPTATMVVVASKTFTTFETLLNLNRVVSWLSQGSDSKYVKDQLVAVTSAQDVALQFGIKAENIFQFKNYIGGRFSLASPIGMSIALGYGVQVFDELLEGMAQGDSFSLLGNHESNATMQFALNLYHHRTVLGMQTRAVLPYTSALGRFPAYLQQLIMESLGKSVTHSGEVTDECGIMVFGEPGTNAQHSFMQYLHQSPQIVPVDFIVILDANPKSAHGLLVNAIAQANALAIGKSATDLNLEGVPEDLIPHQVMQGNRPSSVIAIKDLSAVSIGQLIAFYENVVSILGILWGVNAYDQWGVELGKEVSANLINSINARNLDNLDESTKWILQKYLDAN